MRLLILLIPLLLCAYSDRDFDGVEDTLDRCPATPFMDLVDASGCSIKRLEPTAHLQASFGLLFSRMDNVTLESRDTLYSMLQLDYTYERFNIWANTGSYSSQEDRGTNDSYIGVRYNYTPFNTLQLAFGGGLVIPTYSGAAGALDTFASLDALYNLNQASFYASAIYTHIGDDDSEEYRYQDTAAYALGVSYLLHSSLQGTVNYYESGAIYKGLTPIRSTAIILQYALSSSMLAETSYTLGLSESSADHTLVLNLHYRFF